MAYHPKHCGLTTVQVKTLYDAAELLTARWPSPLAESIAPLLVEVAIHRADSGSTARKNWIASLRMLAGTLNSITKMEAAKHRHPSDIR